jgi:hypothetical protein
MKISDMEDSEFKDLLLRVGYRSDFDLEDDRDRIVKQEYIEHNGHNYFLSTVDMGMNLNFFGKPLYYETALFDSDDTGITYMKRYGTRTAAAKGHEKVKLLLLNNKLGVSE